MLHDIPTMATIAVATQTLEMKIVDSIDKAKIKLPAVYIFLVLKRFPHDLIAINHGNNIPDNTDTMACSNNANEPARVPFAHDPGSCFGCVRK